MMGTARPVEMLILIVAVVGLCCNLFSLRMAIMYIRDLKGRNVNGLKLYIAKAHKRDEILRVFIMLGFVAIGLFLTMGTVLPVMPYNLWMVRALIVAVEFLIVSKSIMNIRDGFELTEIQNTKRQRVTDSRTDAPTVPNAEKGQPYE